MAYVYRHRRNDANEIFYIGIGGDSVYKRANDKSRRSEFWKRIVNKTSYDVEIILDDISYEFAKIKEIEFIKTYGRKDLGTGTLVNMTDGGDGTLNMVYTDEYRKKLSDKAKERVVSDEQKEKLRKYRLGKSAWNKGIIGKDSHMFGTKVSDESKLKGSVSKLGENNPMYGKVGVKCDNYKGEIVAFKDGAKIGRYEGIYDAANKLNVTATKISAVLVGRRNHTGGYTFERINK